MPPPISHRDLMLAQKAAKPFDRPGWLYELKLDGYRVLAIRDGAGVRLLSRRGNDLAASFPEIMADLIALPEMIADGELVVLDAEGKPQFERLQRRARFRRPDAIAKAARGDPAAV